MAQKDPQQMTTGEVAEMARKAGIKGVEDMNKQQMLQAMGKGGSAPTPSGRGGGHRPAPKGTSPKDWKNIPGNQS